MEINLPPSNVPLKLNGEVIELVDDFMLRMNKEDLITLYAF